MAYLGRFDGSQATHASPAMAAASKEVAIAADAGPSALPTSTKWSVLSSRVEGLVAELSEVVGKQDGYCVSVSHAEGPTMAAVREKMLATPWGDLWAQKQTMFSYGEEMSTDPLEAMLLKQLVFMAAPHRVLEIGMFVGYGSVAMLEGSPTTRVVSLEIDPYLKGWLASCLEGFPSIAARHEVVVGAALDSLLKLEGEFDMIFVDANKAEYKRYVELILERKLLSSKGVLVCDNVLYNGYPYAHEHFDAQPARRHFGNAIRDFNQWVADHPSLEQVVLPLRDGISIVRQLTDASEQFQFELNIGNHPCSWGVDYAECPTNPPWDRVVQCMADAGFAGTELGPVGYYDPEGLSGMLQKLNLQLTAGNIFEKLHEADEVPKILEKVHASCRILKQHGAKFFVIVPHVAEERIPTTGRSKDAPRLSDSAWKQLMEAIQQVAEVCKSYGIACTLHPHAGCWIEYEDEVERAMADLPSDLVGLCLDTGHFTYAGMDPVAKYQKHAARIPYMHFKDINGKVLEQLRQEKRGFWDGIKEGVFCPLGQGLVDFPTLLRVMKAHKFSGWVTVEQDADNSIENVEARLQGPFEACKLNMQYLRSLGVVRPAEKQELAAIREEMRAQQSKYDALEKAYKELLAKSNPTAQVGNLVHHDHTWRILRPGDAVPRGATLSDCSVEPSVSEYANEGACQSKAWFSHSVISFDYRVVEVPQGHLLDPACDALIFGHLAHGSEERTAAMAQPQRRLVVIDKAVYDLYGDRVRAYFEARSVEHEVLVLSMVEENKSMETALKVAKKMKEFNIDRRTEPVLAIGGGVCLDVVGCAAALFRRRTPYIRVPTTALSYVDASVGAKNGVNFAGSKNRLGTYVPPCAALLDTVFFETQAQREVAQGVGEMCKMAIMKSPELFGLLEQHGPRLVERKFASLSKSDDVPARVVQLSIETMLEELSPNLWENSLDRLVDFGHATGQDLEMEALGTEHELFHGEAVAVDMALMTVLAQQIGLITEAERDRTHNMLRGCQVPVYSPVMTYELFTEAVRNRVKNSMGQKFPLPAGIGKGQIVNDVSDETLQRAFLLWEELCGSSLGQLSTVTTIVADTGDIEAIRKIRPTDATTNPSLLYKAATMDAYRSLVDDAVDYGIQQAAADGKPDMGAIIDKLSVNFGKQILDIVPGYVSTEVDARLSYDTDATIARARRMIALYAEIGVPRERVLIKIASTWEGIRACEVLQREGILCNLTLLFSLVQAAACAEAGATLISPFVGRIMDWYKARDGVSGYEPDEDPGVLSVRNIYAYYKHFSYKTIVMGASFRNIGEVTALAGCDRLTIAPGYLQELKESKAVVKRRLAPEMASYSGERLAVDETSFRRQLDEDAMATEKLTDGIRAFSVDLGKLEEKLSEIILKRA